jgi:hypothetical protein
MHYYLLYKCLKETVGRKTQAIEANPIPHAMPVCDESRMQDA